MLHGFGLKQRQIKLYAMTSNALRIVFDLHVLSGQVQRTFQAVLPSSFTYIMHPAFGYRHLRQTAIFIHSNCKLRKSVPLCVKLP